MQDSSATAYVAFGFLLAMTVIGGWFTYRLFHDRSYYSTIVHIYIAKVYYYYIAIVVLFVYFAIGLVLLVLAAVHGHPWTSWSWRWSVVGALFDSINAASATKAANGWKLVTYFQILAMSIEVLVLLVSPAIPNPLITQYLTFGIIIFHASWTALSARLWTCPREKTVRWAASAGQAISAGLLIVNALGFVTLFCICSIAVYVEELTRSKESFGRLGSCQQQQPALELPLTEGKGKKSELIYKIVFLGEGPQRNIVCTRVLDHPVLTNRIGCIDIYRVAPDIHVASTAPSLGMICKEDTESCVNEMLLVAAAVVLVVDPGNEESVHYARTLKGFRPKQPVLLVSYRVGAGIAPELEQGVRDLAAKNGWAFATENDIITAYDELLDRMREYIRNKPPMTQTVTSMAARSRWGL